MQKDVYLTLCQRFISVLGDHLARCDQEGSDYESPWFQATLDHFRQLLVKVCVWCCVCVCVHPLIDRPPHCLIFDLLVECCLVLLTYSHLHTINFTRTHRTTPSWDSTPHCWSHWHSLQTWTTEFSRSSSSSSLYFDLMENNWCHASSYTLNPLTFLLDKTDMNAIPAHTFTVWTINTNSSKIFLQTLLYTAHELYTLII